MAETSRRIWEVTGSVASMQKACGECQDVPNGARQRNVKCPGV